MTILWVLWLRIKRWHGGIHLIKSLLLDSIVKLASMFEFFDLKNGGTRLLHYLCHLSVLPLTLTLSVSLLPPVMETALPVLCNTSVRIIYAQAFYTTIHSNFLR